MEKPAPGSWVPLQAELSVYTRNYLTPLPELTALENALIV